MSQIPQMTDEQLQAEVTAWLDANWDAATKKSRHNVEAGLKGWLKAAFEARWSVPRWPVEWYGPVSYTHLDVYKRQL